MDKTIGNQTLILGDSLTHMQGIGRVNHIITDPPYEQSLHDSKANKKVLRTDGGAEFQGLDFAGIDAIRDDFIYHAGRICDGWLIAFCTIEGVARWADAINPSPIKYKRACIWVKPDSAPQMNGQCPAQGAECFITAWAGAKHSVWNGRGKRGVYTHNTNTPDRVRRARQSKGHPTEKPIDLMCEILGDFTNEGDIVFDPFMGSGTTLVACEMMGRIGVGCELDKKWFGVACERVGLAKPLDPLYRSGGRQGILGGAPMPKQRRAKNG